MSAGDAVIVLCPCCASAQDANVEQTPQTFTCVSCGQSWTMVVDRERQATHSLS